LQSAPSGGHGVNQVLPEEGPYLDRLIHVAAGGQEREHTQVGVVGAVQGQQGQLLAQAELLLPTPAPLRQGRPRPPARVRPMRAEAPLTQRKARRRAR
jgi:hypothetical protein